MNILVSFPKSASDWIRYVSEFIYLRPTADENPSPVLKLKHIYEKIEKDYDIPVDKDATPILIKCHYLTFLNPNDRCIFSYRDPKEVVFSYAYAQFTQRNPTMAGSLKEFIESNHSKLGHEFTQWMNNFTAYCQHNNEKTLIRYDDLLADPQSTISRLVDFLGRTDEATEREQLLFEDLESHTQNCIDYKKHPTHMPNNTFGTKEKYDPSMLTEGEHGLIDSFLHSLDSVAFDELQKMSSKRPA